MTHMTNVVPKVRSKIICFDEYFDEKNQQQVRCIHCGLTYASDSRANGTKKSGKSFQGV